MSTLVCSLGGRNVVAGIVKQDGSTQALPLLNTAPEETSLSSFSARLRRLGATDPEAIAFCLKRVMGRRFDDPLFSDWGYQDKISSAPNGSAWMLLGNRVLPPEEVLGSLLSWIRGTAETVAEQKVDHLVLLHPPFLPIAHRQAYLDAGTIAGFHSCDLIIDSLASVPHSSLPLDSPVAIVDVGAHQVSTSILKADEHLIRLVGSSTLWRYAGSESLEADDNGKRLAQSFQDSLRQALARSGFVPSDLSHVWISGGFAKHEGITEVAKAHEHYEVLDYAPIDNLSNAISYSRIFRGVKEGKLFTTVVPSTISISVDGGEFKPILHCGASVPTREERIIRPSQPRQHEVLIDVVENIGTNRTYVGKYSVAGIPGSANGRWSLLVEFRLDRNGMLHMSSTELLSGRAADMRRIASPGLPRRAVNELRDQYNG